MLENVIAPFNVHSTFACIIAISMLTKSSVHAAAEVRGATVGLPVTLPCNIGTSTAQAMWYSPASILLTIDYERKIWDTRFKVLPGYQRERNLRISSVQMTDGGIYLCKQSDTSAVLSQVHLLINVPPTLEKSENLTVMVNVDVTIMCRLTTGTPQPIIRWTFHGNRDEYSLPNIGENVTLKEITRDQAGEYTCTADNGVPPAARKTIKVDVMFKPVLVIPYRNLYQSPGSSALLTCVVDANPLGDIYWRRDRDGARPAAPQTASHSSSLNDPEPLIAATASGPEPRFRFQKWTISRDGYKWLIGAFVDHVSIVDDGLYSCHASNTFGTAHASMRLIVSNDSDLVIPPTSFGSTSLQSSSSVIIVLATVLAFTLLVALVLGLAVVKQRRNRQDNETNRPAQIYKNCRS